MKTYCEVAVPVPLRTTFIYGVPKALEGAVVPGCRVLAPFRRKTIAGVVTRMAEKPPEDVQIKDVLRTLDALPALPEKLLELGEWVAKYYLAPIGEVFRAMLPPLVEVRTLCEVVLTEAGRAALAGAERDSLLGEAGEDWRALELLEKESGVMRLERFEKLAGMAGLAMQLGRRGWIELRERPVGRKSRTQKILAWKGGPHKGASTPPAGMQQKLEALRKLLQIEHGPMPIGGVLQSAGVTRSFIEKLVREELLESWDEPVDPMESALEASFEPPTNVLNEDQEQALEDIRAWIQASRFTTGLLYGVTGSGKTEVYLRAVQETLVRGKTAIVLVPEIALTLWVGRLCRAWFGARYEGVAVLHSALGEAERAREWWRVRRGEARVVVGTRSAVFAPVEHLGLVIVDEEQEASYKQEETPRYNGRDVAIVRAKIEGAAALLGSATPSIESYYRAQSGAYQLLTLDRRVADRPMARVEIVDLREDFRETHDASPFSTALRLEIAQCLEQKTQALVLINRRGYSWFALCRSCGATVQCKNCSIAMTYHKARQRLECHYCGAVQPVPKKCPKCESRYVYFFGEGSEQLEERLRQGFPGARVARLDRDTARTKRQYQQTLGAFAAGALDILVGTQMLAKGHDFQKVTLVGVVAADASLNLPDFRAAERTFQILTQVAGRAGRGELPGHVLVQTFYPEHYAIQDAACQDYPSFFEREMHFRRLMGYPPFTALANVIVRNTALEKAIRWARQIAEYLAPLDGQGLKVLGPAAAPLARLKREYRFQFLLKAAKRAVLTRTLAGILDFCERKEIPAQAVVVDMDPVSLM
jgi:primosomal protein N' (replication factor Y)